jgi:hypothetical protein
MANTYEAIATVTVGSGGAADIDFQNIPQTYTDLSLFVSGREETATDWVFKIKFNNVTTNLSSRRLSGNGATAASDSSATEIVPYMNGSDGTASTFGNAVIYIPNYTSSNNKSVSIDSVSENNGTTAYMQLNAGLWSSSSAIDRITLYTASGDFAQYSTATLYGIKNS